MEENVMKKGSSRFSILGRARINEYTYSMDTKSQSGFIYNKINIGVDCGKGNVVYSEMMGGYNPEKNPVIYVHGKKANDKGDGYVDDYKAQLQIAWEDRFDTSITSTIGENCFIKVGLEKDRDGKNVTEKFLSAYDAIEYIQKHLHDGDIVRVNGTFEYSIYNGNISTKKIINSIYLVSPETDPETFKATFTQTFLYDDTSVDKKVNDKNCMTVYGYVVDYIGKYNGTTIKQNAMFPKSFDIDLSRYTDKQIELILKQYFDVPRGWYSEMTVEGEISEGVVLAASSVDDLPEEYKTAISLGLISESDAISKVTVTGDKERRFIFNRPLMVSTTNPEDGAITTKIYYEPKRYKTNEVVMYSDLIEEDNVIIEKKDVKTASPTTGSVDLNFLFDNAN